MLGAGRGRDDGTRTEITTMKQSASVDVTLPSRTRDRQSLTCTCAIPTLSTVQADVHPIVDSDSFVATCPNTFTSELHMVDLAELAEMSSSKLQLAAR